MAKQEKKNVEKPLTLEMIDPAKITYTREFGSNSSVPSINKKPTTIKVKTPEEALEWVLDLASLRGQEIEYKLFNEVGEDITHKIDALLLGY